MFKSILNLFKKKKEKDFLFPICKKVSAKTIGQDLIAVKPVYHSRFDNVIKEEQLYCIKDGSYIKKGKLYDIEFLESGRIRVKNKESMGDAMIDNFNKWETITQQELKEYFVTLVEARKIKLDNLNGKNK